MPKGSNSLRKILKNKKYRKLKNKFLRSKRTGSRYSKSPVGKSYQAEAMVLSKFNMEARQPNSAQRKCVKIQINKNGKTILAFLPGNLANTYVNEHDTVMIEGIGGSKGGCYGDLPNVKFKVIKVDNISLLELVKKKKKRL